MGTKETNDQLKIDLRIPKEAKTKWKNVTMAGIVKKASDLVQQTWESENVYNIRQNQKLHHRCHWKLYRVELTVGGQTLAEVKIERDMFHRELPSPLQFLIALRPVNNVIRKFTGDNKYTKSQEKINYLMHIDDIKEFAKYEK